MYLTLVALYSRLYIFCHDHLGFNLRGLGFLLRHIKQGGVLRVQGFKILLDARIATSYARLIAGEWNEPETHVFIRTLAKKFKALTFYDIGANIGEMAIHAATLPSFKQIVTFEPDPLCANIIKANAKLNKLPRIQVQQAAVSSKPGKAFLSGGGTPQAQIVSKRVGKSDPAISIITVDSYLKKSPKPAGQLFMLIDVEGHELHVLQGATQTIQRHQPLIVFEFNHISRRHFHLNQVQKILGTKYKILRLNRQGKLDDNLTTTWNCVAVPSHLQGVV